MTILTWLLALLLAPVFIVIALGILIIETLFEDDGVNWDE